MKMMGRFRFGIFYQTCRITVKAVAVYGIAEALCRVSQFIIIEGVKILA